MSKVAPSKSQVGDKVDANAVTLAQDAKFKEADVNRKMKFYGVLQAFRQGRYPDNEQIDKALRYTQQTSPVDLDKLSPDGRKLVQDIREIIEVMRRMVLEKNPNEEFQNFLFHTTKADYKGATGLKVPVSKDEAQKDAETASEALRTLVKLFLRNGEARKLFSDFGLIGRDMFADAAQFAAGKARPNEDKLATVDHPAPDNEFHDDIPEALKKANKAADKKEEGKQDVAAAVQQTANDAQDPNASVEANKQTAADQAAAAGNKLAAKIPDKHKDLAKEHKDKTVNYFKENFPEERRNNFIYRLKKVLVECQRHKDYQDAMDYFLTAFENYKGVANDLHTQTEQNAKSLTSENNVDTAQKSFRRLLERFANGRSTQPIVDALDTLYNDVGKDPELKEFFKRIDTFLRRCVQEPGFVMKEEANTQGRLLRDQGKRFFTGEGEQKGKYQPHFENFFQQVADFFKAMGDDPLNKEFGSKWDKLGKDLFFDSEGKATFKPHLWDDIRDPILPQLLTHIGYVPIPRIEYSDKMVDLVIENLNVDPANLLPNLIEIDAHHFHRMSAYKKITDQHKGTVKVLLSQIQTDLRDVHWAVKKKQGFPKITDSGSADVFLGGHGLTVAVTLETKTGGRDVFTVKQVKAKIHKIDFAIRGSKHDLMAKVAKPLATSLVKKQICKAAEGGIRDGFEKLNDHLVAVRDAEEGKKLDTLKQKFGGSQDAGSKTESKGTFKLATSKRNSILPQMGHPDGWVHKLDAAEEKAKDSGPQHKPDWHSPAFTIVGGAASTQTSATPKTGAANAAVKTATGANGSTTLPNGAATNTAGVAPAISGAATSTAQATAA
ncbi:hypothetical protein FA10DRAFT_150919 [Acaromyces ingoldii]|uniref:Uncharacterized protein n=1 Tax=Acaromyces ingoldii TaxID=215250 RepID=A0A316YLJ4_9BASI|nr:hypothetical protein FA10DRAFT_150919 [Acaromyces ingoldii]PWN89674.1 hypothetical protein FA10DRAFT_150919 [Acaromyces ingoldii]